MIYLCVSDKRWIVKKRSNTHLWLCFFNPNSGALLNSLSVEGGGTFLSNIIMQTSAFNSSSVCLMFVCNSVCHIFFTTQKILISQPTTKIMTLNFQYIVLGSTKVIHVRGMTLFSKCPVSNPQCPPCFPISSLIQSPFEQKQF